MEGITFYQLSIKRFMKKCMCDMFLEFDKNALGKNDILVANQAFSGVLLHKHDGELKVFSNPHQCAILTNPTDVQEITNNPSTC